MSKDHALKWADLLSLDKQLAFYGRYHQNVINKIIHIIFVPTIAWTVLVWLANSPVFYQVRVAGPAALVKFLQWFPINASLLVTLAYVIYYVVLDPISGLLYAPFLLAMCHYAQVFHVAVQQSNWIALALHVTGWVMQIGGHRFIEHNSPAFLENVFQAFVTAPLFVFMEILFALGLRKNVEKHLKDSLTLPSAKSPASRIGKGKKKRY